MLKILLQVLALAEIDLATFAEVAGLPVAALKTASYSIPARQRYQVYEAVQQLNRCEDLSFRMAMFAAHTPLVASTRAFAACLTVRDGLVRLGEVKQPTFGINLEKQESADRYRMEIVPADIEGSIPLWVGLLEVLFVVEVCRTYTAKPIKPLRVGLRCADEVRPEDIAYLGVTPISSVTSFIEFAAEDISLPLLATHEGLFDAIRKIPHSPGPSISGSTLDHVPAGEISEAVGRVLSDMLASGRFSAQDVALKLGMTVRTLQRQLSMENTSFRAVQNDVRMRLAFLYLLEEEKEAAEISFLLGYNDQNSFYRAFKEWTGTTTQDWLREHKIGLVRPDERFAATG